MSKDGDVALDGEAMRSLAAADRVEAMAEAASLDDGRWTKHTEWHWQRPCGGAPLDYWPSRSKWRWKGTNHHGTAADLVAFVVSRDPSSGAIP